MSQDLPDGWAVGILEDLLEPGGLFDGPFGSHLKSEDYTASGVRVIRLENVANLRFVEEKRTYISEAKFLSLSKHRVAENDVIVGSFVDGAVRVCVLPHLVTEAIAKADCFCLRPRPEFDRRFLAFQLGSNRVRDALVGDIHGATRPRITTRQLRSLEVVVAPLAEQRRIVSKVEALLEQVRRAKDRLDRVPLILKRFRQAVVAAACAGRLTEEWRDTATVSKTVAEVLRGLLDHHRAAWDRWRSATPSRARAKYEPPSISTRDDLPDLPATWSWVRFGALGSDPLSTVQTGPFGALLHTDEFVERGVPVIAVGNLTGLGFSREGLYYVTQEKADQLARFDVTAGDLLFARSGATLGKVCIAPDDVRDWRMTGHILRARLAREAVLPAFAAYALWGAPPVLEQVTDGIRGVTRPGYNTSLLEAIHIPLPPPDEQSEIVRRVDDLFALAAAVEQRVERANARAGNLPQAILSKAFAGELVPTEADLARAEGRDYETAEHLLERVRAQSAEPPPTGKRPRPGAPRGRSRSTANK